MVEPKVAELRAALARALDGGAAVAPLPLDPAERRAATEMLEPERPLEAGDIAAVVSTSGSTGRPEGRAVVGGGVRSLRPRRPTATGRSGPLDAGAAGALRGRADGARPVPGRRTVPVTEARPDLRRPGATLGRGPHYLSLVPTQLARALTDPELAEALAGSTRAARRSARQPGRCSTAAREPGSRGHHVRDERDLRRLRVRRDPAGRGVGRAAAEDDRIELAGPMLFSGYRLRPDLTAETLRSDGASRTLITADRGAWADDRLDGAGPGGRRRDQRRDQRRPGRGRNAWPAKPRPPAPPRSWSSASRTRLGHRRSSPSPTARSTLIDSAPSSPIGCPSAASPARLVHLPELPRTGSGKVDRRR